MKLKLKTLLLCFIGGITLIIMLNFISEKINHRANGFIRLVPPNKIVPLEHLNLGYNSFYIGGVVGDSVYLFNNNTPYLFDKISLSKNTLTKININWSNMQKISKAAKMSVDSPFIYLKDGLTSKIAINSINLFKKSRIRSTPYFYAAINLDSVSFTLKVIKNKQTALIVLNTHTQKFISNDTLLKPQREGIFSTDGMLVRTPDGKRIIYLYYYRNQFTVTDRNLNFLYRGHTIDTVGRARIEVSTIKSEGMQTLASPPRVVNKQAFATNKYLFVKSALVANNENPDHLQHLADIDVYAIDNGKYQFSFYLPDFGGHGASDFAVYGDKLVAIYDRYFNVYKLRF